MAWIKRNLYFLIGSTIALGLMIFGVFVLLSQMSAEQQAAEDIQKAYNELTQLNQNQASSENIEAMKKQEAQLRAYVAKAKGFFQRIPPIPNFTTNRVSNADFAAELRNTVFQLKHMAEQQSVELPPDYYFSFEAQQKSITFDTANLDNMAVHLGEIKAICEILFNAKINYLYGIRREIVSESTDLNSPDYINDKTVVTPLAELTPYEVTFKSFSTELADVLAGLASSTNAYIVKSVNVEPAGQMGEDMNGYNNGMNSQPQMQPQNIYQQRRYPGGNPGGYPPGRGGYPPPMQPQMQPQAAAPNRGTQFFLNEKPIRVTLFLEVAKLKRGK